MFFHNRWHPETDHMVDSKRATVSSTDRSLGASTAPGRGSGIGHVTQNPVRIIHRPSERCCAVNLTLCPITMSSTHGFLWLTHVCSQSLGYTISTFGHTCVRNPFFALPLSTSQKNRSCDFTFCPTGGSILIGKPSSTQRLHCSRGKQCYSLHCVH